MITHKILNALERRGVDSYTIATWKAQLLAKHHQAILEAMVVVVVLLLVLLFAGTSGAQDQPPSCGVRPEAAASDVQALTKTITEARAGQGRADAGLK